VGVTTRIDLALHLGC